MRIIAPMMILIMMTSTLAGCTGGDPDAGNNDEIDIENIQLVLNSTLELIENISNDSEEVMYYMNGNFAYNGENYDYDKGVWSEVQNGQWTWVGTPANWIDVVTINQNNNEMITIHYISFLGSLEETIGEYSENTTVSAGSSWDSYHGWEMNCSNGLQTDISNSASLGMPTGGSGVLQGQIFPTAGQDCDYTLNFNSRTEFSNVWWNIVYGISEISEGTSAILNIHSEDNNTEDESVTNTNLSMEVSYVPAGMDENARTTVVINFELYTEDAPIHVDNFLTHIENGNYNSTIFHRIIDNFMIQGGDIEGLNGYGGYAANWYGYCNGQSDVMENECSMSDWTIPDEADNGLTHTYGALSMAKTSSPNTGGSQFFIVPSDSNPSHLNGVHTVFGYVTGGLDSITDISEVDVNNNDKPTYDVIVESITID
jgi:peptidyl-prolyl cis-trans isomerase B (cyclophilin B)